MAKDKKTPHGLRKVVKVQIKEKKAIRKVYYETFIWLTKIFIRVQGPARKPPIEPCER